MNVLGTHFLLFKVVTLLLVFLFFAPIAKILSDQLSLLKVTLLVVLSLHVLLLLIPTPLIHLRLGQAGHLRHLQNFLLGPVHLSVELLLEELDLSATLSFSFFYTILILPVSFIFRKGLFLYLLCVALLTY